MPCWLLCAKRYTKCVFQTCHDCMPSNTTMLSESRTTCSCCPTSLHTIDKRRAHCTRQTNNQVCGGYLGVLNIQPYAPPKCSALAAVIGYCVCWLDATDVAHVNRDFIISTVRLQFDLGRNFQHCIQLSIVKAIIGTATNHMQSREQPKPLTVQLMSSINKHTTSRFVHFLVDLLVYAAPLLITDRQRPFGNVCLAWELPQYRTGAPCNTLANHASIKLEEFDIVPSPVCGEVDSVVIAETHEERCVFHSLCDRLLPPTVKSWAKLGSEVAQAHECSSGKLPLKDGSPQHQGDLRHFINDNDAPEHLVFV